MSLGGPNIYPSVLSWMGISRELTAGTPLVPVVTHPFEQADFSPEDMPKFLKDQAIRGSMTNLFYETLGVESAQFSMGGPNFLDTHGYFFDNVFGDLSTTGSSIGQAATFNSALAVGATAGTLAATLPSAYTAGATIQIGTGATTEVVVIGSTSATSVLTFAISSGGEAYPLRFTHPTGPTVSTCGTPFTHRWSALNSPLGYGGAYGAQPPTHTFTDVTNIVNVFASGTYGTAPTNTYGARQYPSAVLKDISFSGNAEQLLNVKCTGDSWLSVAAGTAVTNVTTNSRPIPNWNSTVVVAGNTVSSTGAYSGIGNFSVSFTRQTQTYWIVAGTQTPFVIARGPLNMNGSIDWDPTNSETPLDLMLLNAQAPMTITVSNQSPTVIPNSGTPFTLTFTASQVANIKSKVTRTKDLISYSNSYEGIANSTDSGGSGGLGPGTITLVNNTAVY